MRLTIASGPPAIRQDGGGAALEFYSLFDMQKERTAQETTRRDAGRPARQPSIVTLDLDRPLMLAKAEANRRRIEGGPALHVVGDQDDKLKRRGRIKTETGIEVWSLAEALGKDQPTGVTCRRPLPERFYPWPPVRSGAS